jgi:hypothetical protein
MRKYRPSNHTPIGSLILLLLLGIISAGALGGILWAVDNYLHIYLVVAFPLIAGGVAGGLLVLGVRSGKVRSPFIAALIGLLTGVLIFGVYHFAGYYITFRQDMRTSYVEHFKTTPTDAELDDAIDTQILEPEVQDTGFVGYLKLVAKEGFTITSSTYSSSSGSDIDLKDQWAFVYWGVELLLAGIIAAVLASGEARQPFDEDSNSWYGAPTTLALATLKSRKALDRTLNDGDYQTAGSLLTVQNIRYPRNEIMLRRSPVASGSLAQQDIYLSVNYAQRKGRSVVKKAGLISPSELDLIKRAIPQGESQPTPKGRR